jgi:hypothetical protein
MKLWVEKNGVLHIKMAWTSPTEINATAGMDSFIPYLSEVTHFWFGRMLMIAIFVIFFFGYLRAREDDYVGAFAISSYVTFVIGLMFWVIGMVTGMDLAYIIGAVVLGSIILLMQKKEY